MLTKYEVKLRTFLCRPDFSSGLSRRRGSYQLGGGNVPSTFSEGYKESKNFHNIFKTELLHHYFDKQVLNIIISCDTGFDEKKPL